MSGGATMLEIDGVHVRYGPIEALHGISLRVEAGTIVTLIGANGAGKSTTLRTISGLLAPTSGQILFEGQPIHGRAPHEILGLGIGHVPEGRQIFPHLTVWENLRLGAFRERRAGVVLDRMGKVFQQFPLLAERARQLGGTLSGGEQQMLAIGRALMSSPRLLMLDEPSLGLAPLIIDRIYEVIARLRDEMKMTVLLVEQNAQRALDIADYGYILETGRVVLDGTAKKLTANEDVQEFYLGVSSSGRKSLRDVKHYKRRKRWLS
jgi:branched-chain amino acid transport system ATP-binding protein